MSFYGQFVSSSSQMPSLVILENKRVQSIASAINFGKMELKVPKWFTIVWYWLIQKFQILQHKYSFSKFID